jgi:hypothetical protein
MVSTLPAQVYASSVLVFPDDTAAQATLDFGRVWTVFGCVDVCVTAFPVLVMSINAIRPPRRHSTGHHLAISGRPRRGIIASQDHRNEY